MAHDGASMTSPILLPDLLELTGAAVAPAEALLDRATTLLRDAVIEEGRVSGRAIEENQTAAHGLAWLATYVQSLRQMHSWAEGLQADGKFGELEALLLQITFGEYLWQIYGGIPMSQGEVLRPQDMGLSQDDQRALMEPAVMTLCNAGNTEGRANAPRRADA